MNTQYNNLKSDAKLLEAVRFGYTIHLPDALQSTFKGEQLTDVEMAYIRTFYGKGIIATVDEKPVVVSALINGSRQYSTWDLNGVFYGGYQPDITHATRYTEAHAKESALWWIKEAFQEFIDKKPTFDYV